MHKLIAASNSTHAWRASVCLAVLLLAGIAAAHEDRLPTVEIKAPFGVDTAVTIKVLAEDFDFRAGISFIELYEDGRLAQHKECNQRVRCELEESFEHAGEGLHSYKALVADVTGHRVYATKSVRFAGSDKPPVVSTLVKAGVDEGSELRMDVSVSDPNGDPVTLAVRNMPSGSRFENGQFVWTPTFSQSGTYVLMFEANTATKKTTKSVKVEVRDRNREFELRESTPTNRDLVTINEGEPKKFFVNAVDPDGDMLAYRWVLDGRVVSYSPSYIYRPSFSDAGEHRLEVTIKEGSFFLARAEAATKSRAWTISVRDQNRQPTVAEHRKYVVEEGSRVSFVVKFDDPDKDVLSIEALDLPEGATFDERTGVFRWQTEVGDHGRYQPRFRVRDAKGLTASRGVQIEIRKKPAHEIVHEDLHRIGRIDTFTDSDRDSLFGYGSYGLIG